MHDEVPGRSLATETIFGCSLLLFLSAVLALPAWKRAIERIVAALLTVLLLLHRARNTFPLLLILVVAHFVVFALSRTENADEGPLARRVAGLRTIVACQWLGQCTCGMPSEIRTW